MLDLYFPEQFSRVRWLVVKLPPEVLDFRVQWSFLRKNHGFAWLHLHFQLHIFILHLVYFDLQFLQRGDQCLILALLLVQQVRSQFIFIQHFIEFFLHVIQSVFKLLFLAFRFLAISQQVLSLRLHHFMLLHDMQVLIFYRSSQSFRIKILSVSLHECNLSD